MRVTWSRSKRPDVGGERKRLSLLEARITAVAVAFMRLRIGPKELIEPMKALRNSVAWPGSKGVIPTAQHRVERTAEVYRTARDNGAVPQGLDALRDLYEKECSAAGVPQWTHDLNAPRRWTDAQLNAALNAELLAQGCERTGPCFLTGVFEGGNGRIEISDVPEGMTDLEGWVTLNVQTLFKRIGASPS